MVMMKLLYSGVIDEKLWILPLSLSSCGSLILRIDTSMVPAISETVPRGRLQDLIDGFRCCCLDVRHQSLPFKPVVEFLRLKVFAAFFTESFDELVILSCKILMLNMHS